MQNEVILVDQDESKDEKSIDWKAIFYLCLSHWYWFLISVVLALGFATYYLHKTVPIYTRTAKLLVKSDKEGYDVVDFSEVGIMNGSAKIYNELITFSSIDNVQEAVRLLHLDMNYTIDGRFRPILLYDNTLPATVDLLGNFDNVSASFDMKIQSKGRMDVSTRRSSMRCIRDRHNMRFKIEKPIDINGEI